MIAVIFEVFPAPGRKQEYLDIASSLRPELDNIDGFISIERFASLTNEGKILSLSFWRDEEAVQQWRRLERHRLAQSRGREGQSPVPTGEPILLPSQPSRMLEGEEAWDQG